jgi:Sulfatase-modifying factor enzyme 1/Domain of unknown function (DUF4062)/AAA ATPase domain
MTTIYLSSTYEDLKEYRRVVFDALRKSGYQVNAMEYYVATDQRPVDKCLKDVAEADIYVGIFAFRYGYVPPVGHNNPKGLSITELEYRQAESLKKPCLTFVVNQSTPWPPVFMDSQAAEDKGERINTFRQYLLTEKLASSFSSPHELATLVLAAVAKHQDATKKIDAATRQKTETAPAITWDINKHGSPYPGLMHFSRKYAPVFFGRDAEVREVLDRLRLPEGRFLIISGGSGTGKSSLVDAGVLPRIEESGIGEERKFVCVRMVPSQGSNPFDALLRPLHGYAEHAGLNVFELAEKLGMQPDLLPEKIHEIIAKGMIGHSLVLFLDQMEELFTVREPAQSYAFLSALYKAANEASLSVIATIRSDFLHHLHDHENMRNVISGRSHIGLGPVDLISLREMIIKPAQCAGLSIPDTLVRRLVQDAGQEPGSLPLLAFALQQLFEKRNRNEITEKAYDDFGGLAGAIGRHAEAAEDKISKDFKKDAKELLPDIFKPLVVINIDRQPTRRRASPAEFDERIQPIKDLLIKERLLTSEGQDQQSTISVAHEKLFVAWATLAGWVAANRDDQFVIRQAEIAGDEWQKHNYDTRYLWHADRHVRLGEIIARLDREQIKDSARLFAAPQKKLVQRLEDNSLSHQERLTIGLYLADLGDPRAGVGLRQDGLPDIEWVEIPGGKVKLNQVEAVFDVKRFRIAKYPVTNVQFQVFTKDGYGNPEWWEGIEQSELPVGPRWKEPNSPREAVSWFEAVAFCRWLSKRTGSKVRLPTEWEWQLAATGGDPQREGFWDTTKYNSDESGLKRTSPVGMYPNGATQQGVLDMDGNVAEWCLDEYQSPGTAESLRSSDNDERGLRVIRGGSWKDELLFQLVSFRFGYYADNRYYFIGFRLAQDIP